MKQCRLRRHLLIEVLQLEVQHLDEDGWVGQPRTTVQVPSASICRYLVPLGSSRVPE